MLRAIKRFWREEEGVTLAEYGLALGVISLVAAVGAIVLGTDISQMFTNVGEYLVGVPMPS